MKAMFPDTLLQLFHQVIDHPKSMPVIAIEDWPEDSVERQLLSDFQGVLEAIRQSKQGASQALEQLDEKEAQYRGVFEATYDALLIIDLEDGCVVEANPAACKVYGYSREEFVGLPPSGIIHRDDLPFVLENVFPMIKAGNEYHARGVGLRKDGTTFHLDVHDTAIIYQGKPHMLAVVRDITEQVQAEQQLREKEGQYRSIFEATADALFIVDLEDVCIVQANPAACGVYGYSYEEFVGRPLSAIIHPDDLPSFMENVLPMIQAGGEDHARGVMNLRKDGTAFPIEVHETAFTYQGKLHMLAVVRDITEQLRAQQLLEQRVEERTRELSTLLEVSHNVASTLELRPLLGLILDQLKAVTENDGAAITIVEGEDLVIADYRGPRLNIDIRQIRLPLKRLGLIWEMIRNRQPVIIDDVWGQTALAQVYRKAVGPRLHPLFVAPVRTWMGVPLALKDRVVGMLALVYREPGFFKEQRAMLVLTIANQAAVAIENARLYEQAQELAALEERLARELHDSVSQALYGISLGAHTALTLLNRDPGRVAEPLNYVLAQAEAALTEMRALIFELRPESLETEGLIGALGRQATALQARHGMTVSTELGDEPDLTLKVKQELYRVVQEALHNTVKHAQASKVSLSMNWNAEGLTLEVCDDGIGFDATSAFPGHLGLQSMRERVKRLGGLLQIESAPGCGTRIHVQLTEQMRL
jgi:PAS domain S-box-containing protein